MPLSWTGARLIELVHGHFILLAALRLGSNVIQNYHMSNPARHSFLEFGARYCAFITNHCSPTTATSASLRRNREHTCAIYQKAAIIRTYLECASPARHLLRGPLPPANPCMCHVICTSANPPSPYEGTHTCFIHPLRVHRITSDVPFRFSYKLRCRHKSAYMRRTHYTRES